MLVELFPKLVAEEAAETRRQGTWRPRCSSGGTERCLRAEVYKAKGAPAAPFPGRMLLVFADGDWAEEVTNDLVRRTIYKLSSEQMGLNPLIVPGSHNGYHCEVCSGGDCEDPGPTCTHWIEADVVHGHIDGLITDPLGRDYLYEHKSTNRYAFKRWADGAEVPWDYVTQGALYVRGLRKEGADVDHLVMVIKCKDTSQYLEYVISVSRDEDGDVCIEQAVWMEGDHPVDIPLADEDRVRTGIIAASLERFRQIVAFRDADDMPDRPFPFDHWRCQYCAFGSGCWAGYEAETTELEEGMPVPITDPALRKLILDFEEAGAAQRAAKKRYEALRDDIKVAFGAHKVRLGYIEFNDGSRVNATIKWQSRKGLDTEEMPEEIRLRYEKITTFEKVDVRRQKAPKPKDDE